ncbi:hypothetical protein RKD27_000271 [Streptomyces sp. SAI-126]
MIPRWKNDDASGASAETPAEGRKCRPLVFILTTGQAADSPQFIPVLKKVRVRGPVGRPRIRPDAVAGDKAYPSRGNRAHLRKRLIKVVIPEKKDQAANRKKGSRGGRPVSSKHGEASPPDTTRLPTATSPISTCAPR